jgi:hypothetical protein
MMENKVDIEDRIQKLTLNDDDVNSRMKVMNSMDQKVVNTLLNDYRNAVLSIISMAKKQAEEDNDDEEIVEIDRIRRIMGAAPVEEVFIRSMDKVFGACDHICNKNAKYFLDKDYSKFIKKDQNQVLIETLVNLVKSKYITLTKKQQDAYWSKAGIMLKCVLEFMKASEKLK